MTRNPQKYAVLIASILMIGRKRKGMQLKNGLQGSASLNKHIEMGIGLKDSFYRLGSEKWLDLHKEVKAYWQTDNIILSDPDAWVVENLNVGEEAEYNGETVLLDVPERGGKKKFIVYHRDDNGKVHKVEWGDPNLTVKNDLYSNSKSFWARQRCDQKTDDPTTAGFWSCYGPTLFGKQLELESDLPW
jgi:hypothetical protein